MAGGDKRCGGFDNDFPGAISRTCNLQGIALHERNSGIILVEMLAGIR